MLLTLHRYMLATVSNNTIIKAMIPIKFQDEKELQGLAPHQLQDKILEICQRHHAENRALAFAFILFGFDNP